LGKGTKIASELKKKADEYVSIRKRVDAFFNSDLNVLLTSNGITEIALCGLQTSGFVLSALRAAADLDYQVTVITDCVYDSDPEVNTFLLDKVFPSSGTVSSLEDWAKSIKSYKAQGKYEQDKYEQDKYEQDNDNYDTGNDDTGNDDTENDGNGYENAYAPNEANSKKSQKK